MALPTAWAIGRHRQAKSYRSPHRHVGINEVLPGLVMQERGSGLFPDGQSGKK
ncbi:hypothetical protein C7S15_3122 [Burkholderia cepacia]|nr:hypothetical protein [Burkholderia cepacia]